MNMSSILSVKNISKSFGSGHTKVLAVNDISMDVAQGELVLIMGPSGSGKTTLLSMLGGLLKPTSGSIRITDAVITDIPESSMPDIRAQKIGFIFQAFNLLEALSAEENILFPAQLISGSKSAARERAQQLIKKLGLEHRRHSLPANLSGGEKQRVAIARALINKPLLILADEPTGNLDSKSGQDVMMILHDIVRDEQCSVIFVTHDSRVEEIADRVLWVEDGSLRDRKRETHSWVRDPVCGMRVDEWTAEVFVEFTGTRYVFCSQRCRERFDSAPELFLNSRSEADD